MKCQIANCEDNASYILYNKVYRREILVCERCAEEMLSMDSRTYEFIDTFGEKEYGYGEGKLWAIVFTLICFGILFAVVSGLVCGQ